MLFELKDVKYREVLHIPELTITGTPVTCITGPSGGGKTTLLRLLGRMIAPDSGEIRLDGDPISQCGAVEYRRRVTMLPQQPVLYDGTIRDNLSAGFTLRGQTCPQDAELTDMLKRMNLQKDLNGEASTLSGGERQRLCMGRVLLLKSQIYLMDEPSGALDRETEDEVIGGAVDYLREIGAPLVMVTHSEQLAQKFSNSLIRIDGGRAEVLQ